jgi:6-phospho-beta-glucosidase
MELELAIDVMSAIFNDEGAVYPCNVPNRGAIAFFPADRVVEVPCLVDKHGATPLAQPELPAGPRGLLAMLSEYQALAAKAAWEGDRMDGIRALAANPLVLDLCKATTIYDELAAAHRRYLPAS